MRKTFNHRFLVGTALAALMTVAGGALAAPAMDESAIEAAVPMPEPANVPPPSIDDITPANAIPTPEPANVPPPSLKDVLPATAVPPSKPAEAKPVKAENGKRAIEPQRAEDAKPAEAKPQQAEVSKPAGAKPQQAEAAEPVGAKPQPAKDVKAAEHKAETVDIKSLTGKELVKAPVAHDLTGVDAELARALRQILATRLSSYIEHKNDRSAVEVFYRDRGFLPLWVVNGQPTARGKAAATFLRGVEADGLNPEDYPVPSFSGSAQDQAKAELELTQSVLTFARHASGGRVAFSRVSAAILFHPEASEPAHVLAKLAAAKDVTITLDSYYPHEAGYQGAEGQAGGTARPSRRGREADHPCAGGTDAAARDEG